MMTEIQVPIERSQQRVLIINSSYLNLAQGCFRKYQFSAEKNLEPVFGNRRMEEGSLIHQALEFHYKGIKAGVSLAEIIPGAINQVRLSAGELSRSPEEVDNVIRVYSLYADFYKFDTWIPLEIEQPFVFTLFETDDLKVLYEGKVDLVVKHSQTGETSIVDHKSEEKATIPQPLSNQFMSYMLGNKVNRIIINKLGFQKKDPPSGRFKRQTLMLSQDVLEEWRESAIYHTLHLDKAIQAGYFPPTYSECWRCIFKEICALPVNGREDQLRLLFKRGERHEPSAVLGE